MSNTVGVPVTAEALGLLGGQLGKEVVGVTQVCGEEHELGLVLSREPYIWGLREALEKQQTALRAGDHVWLSRAWHDDDERPTLCLRRVRGRTPLLSQEIERSAGVQFSMTPESDEELLSGVKDSLLLPPAVTWTTVLHHVARRGDSRLAELVSRYIDSGCDFSRALVADAELETPPPPAVRKSNVSGTTSTGKETKMRAFLRLIQGEGDDKDE
ncbi:hypothetical protein ACFYTC_20720 [Actinomadura nitritigenes]|uniref:hypothetical protein n=1 Tax=Actinomadura nitritigenes TaxID=134602 RepID=UPI003697E62B